MAAKSVEKVEVCSPGKILFIATVYTHLAAFHIPFIRLFQRCGYAVHAAASPEEGGMDKVAASGVTCWTIPFSRSLFSLHNVRALRKLKNLFGQHRYDLIHVHTPIAAWLTRYVAKDMGQGVIIYSAHGFHFAKDSPWIKRWAFYLLEKVAARWTDALIVINPEDYEHGKRLGFESERNLFLVRGVGVDLPRYDVANKDKSQILKDLELPDNVSVVTCVAELTHRKNQLQLIKAWNLVAQSVPNAFLLIVGDGKNRKKIERIIKSDRIPRVRLLGFRADIPEILAVTDIFTLASRREGLPKSVMEAMAAGVPIVATDVRGNRDLVDNKETGMLVKPGDIRSLADALVQMLQDQGFRKRMGIKAFARAQDYSMELIIDRMAQIYSQFLPNGILPNVTCDQNAYKD